MATSDLTKAIDNLVEQKTFSLDALEAIKALRDKAIKLEGDVDAKAQLIEKLRQEAATRDQIIGTFESKSSALNGRETAVTEREKKITELERSSAVAQAVSNTWSSCFDRLFANRVIRETVTSSVPIARSYGSGSSDVIEHHTKTDTVTKQEG